MNKPEISLVTPSFNQRAFLGAAIDSVLNQNCKGLQYVVMDGGSTDGSADVIHELASGLFSFHIGQDNGQYDAINKGFAMTDAPLMGWLNSDDMHLPWTLSVVVEIFSMFPEVRWLTTRFPLRWDAEGRVVNCMDVRGYSRRGMMRGENLPGAKGFTTWPIQQESTFWRRDLWIEAGGTLNPDLDLAADFDLWMRFARLTDPVAVSVPLAGFRRHGDQKTSKFSAKYEEQAMKSFVKNGGRLSIGRGRAICRDRLPTFLHPLASKLGFLHEAKVIQRSRDNMRWELLSVLT